MKKSFCKLTAVFLSVVMIFCILPASLLTASAYEEVSGVAAACKWVIKDNVLTISGNGTMGNYEKAPWYLYKHMFNEVVIEEGVTNIASYAFYNYCIEKVTIPSSVTAIGDYAFCGTDISYVVMPENLTYIGKHSFGATNLITVNIPNGVTVIENYAFYNNDSLVYAEIPESVTEIKASAFAACDNLLRVEILGEISKFGGDVFSSCNSLRNIFVKNINCNLADGIFYNCNSLENIYFGGSEDEWNNFLGDSNFVFNKPLLNATIHTNATKIPVNVTGIEMFKNPKTEYVQGLVKLDYKGGIIKASYDDNTVKLIDITAEMTEEKFDKLFYGYEFIEVNYGGKQTNYQIYVDGKEHSHNTKTWENGYCSICGRRNDIFKEKVSVEPTIYHGGEYIYGTYSITYEKARYLEVVLTLGYFEQYADDDIMYVYDKDYNLVKSFAIEEVHNELIRVEGDTVRLKLISKSGDKQYNALVYANYGFNDGDINGDYTVNAGDLTTFRKYLSGNMELNDYQLYNSDINIDGKYNLKDFILLKKLLVSLN